MVDIEVEIEKFKQEFFAKDDDIALFKKQAAKIKYEYEIAQTPELPDIETCRKLLDLRPRRRS